MYSLNILFRPDLLLLVM